MKIFYHTDADGKCAGFIVKKYAKHTDGYDMKFYGINYGMPFPFDEIHENEQVFIVDYSILPEEMDRLFEITENIVWIDHHKSAIQRYENYGRHIDGIRYDGIAGCSLTYFYLALGASAEKFNKVPKDKAESFECCCIPGYIYAIADYDIWRFRLGDFTRNFHAGLMLRDHNPWDDVWNELDIKEDDNPFADDIAREGNIARKYRENMMTEYCKSFGFETVLLGHSAFAVNMGQIGSDDFASIDTSKYDLLIGFCYDGKEWNYSLRSSTVDCADIAMRFGGGGHKGAAGFRSTMMVI